MFLTYELYELGSDSVVEGVAAGAKRRCGLIPIGLLTNAWWARGAAQASQSTIGRPSSGQWGPGEADLSPTTVD